ncbi:hypothetical protein N7533_008563 [Penicillium manginii]|uniref:uncharacterized protein n=1 Tax=Penicillium manginii TaxID=203109 RepID=UPI00254996C5|nr:uncharacterized protein N7533_008563 [Penicillium manginii]KAJ5743693.1 hypothetical protein N7533_008563 [Penicillium manginii]
MFTKEQKTCSLKQNIIRNLFAKFTLLLALLPSKEFRVNPVLRKQSDIPTTRTDLIEEKTQAKVSASFVFFRVTCKRMYDQTAKNVGLGE